MEVFKNINLVCGLLQFAAKCFDGVTYSVPSLGIQNEVLPTFKTFGELSAYVDEHIGRGNEHYNEIELAANGEPITISRTLWGTQLTVSKHGNPITREMVNYGFNRFSVTDVTGKVDVFACAPGVFFYLVGDKIKAPKYVDKGVKRVEVTDPRSGESYVTYLIDEDCDTVGSTAAPVETALQNYIGDYDGTLFDLQFAQAIKCRKKRVDAETYAGLIAFAVCDVVNSINNSNVLDYWRRVSYTEYLGHKCFEFVDSGNGLHNQQLVDLFYALKAATLPEASALLTEVLALEVKDEHVYIKINGALYDLYYGGTGNLAQNNHACAVHAAAYCALHNALREVKLNELVEYNTIALQFHYYFNLVANKDYVKISQNGAGGVSLETIAVDPSVVPNWFDVDGIGQDNDLKIGIVRDKEADAKIGDFVVGQFYENGKAIAHYGVAVRGENQKYNLVYESTLDYKLGELNTGTFNPTSKYDIDICHVQATGLLVSKRRGAIVNA